MKIIFDTNFGIIPFQFNVDIYAELDKIINGKYEIIFPEFCLKELKKLKFGDAALELMGKKGVKVVDIPFSKNIDDSIIKFAEKESIIIATQDKEMKEKALKKNLAVITLRNKQFLTKLGGGIE